MKRSRHFRDDIMANMNKLLPTVIGLIHSVALAGVGALAAGCAMVGPDFERPEAPVSEAWIESAVVAESVEHREWWKNFDDPALDSLIQTAYEQNLTLQILLIGWQCPPKLSPWASPPADPLG